MSQFRTTAMAFVITAILGSVVGCGGSSSGWHDKSKTHACAKFTSDYSAASKDISANTSPYPQFASLADSVAIDASLMGTDADVYASGQLEKQIKQVQQSLQEVSDKASKGTLDLTPIDAPLKQVNAACGLNLSVPVVVPTTDPFSG